MEGIMKRKQFLDRLEKEILVLDGGYGTEFFKMGFGNIPGEILNLKHPEVVLKVQKLYVENGADILIANTFNANPIKLESMGFLEHFSAINIEAVKIARKASSKNTLVFGDISSTGKFIYPLGDLDFEEAVECFSAQAQKLVEAEVDGFIIETMSDMKELKAAVLGIRKASSDLPLIAQMTFDEKGLSITGTNIKIFATLFNDLDVDVVGMNCSLGPKGMLKNFETLSQFCNKKISVEPNAGKPNLINGKLQYNTTPEDFANYIEDFVKLGVNIFGGCCGTTPSYIKIINRFTKKFLPKKRILSKKQFLTSRTEIVAVEPFLKIGERINPASRPKFQEQIQQMNFSKVLTESTAQNREGADIIDVNLGIEKTLKDEHFRKAITMLDKQSSIPLSMDIQTNKYLLSAMREYCGRALINSAKVTELSLKRKIKILQENGGMLILLAMNKKIPKTPEDRVKLILEGVAELEKNGIMRERIFADALVLSLGAKENPETTRMTIQLLTENGIKSTLGLSNLSFGMPNRSFINGAFLAQSHIVGLSSAIMNTADSFVMNSLRGALILNGKDVSEKKIDLSDSKFTNFVLNGDGVDLKKEIDFLLKKNSPLHISQKILGDMMEEVGNLYSEGKIYLPHLMLASETAQPIFDYLNSISTEKPVYKGKILLATVEGDIHDIGKKIIGTVLKSSGFEIFDIGTDIDADAIIEKIKELSPDIVGLSAMMTTTIGKIEEVKKLIKTNKIETILIAGGASMNKQLAQEFGCDGYAEKASGVVKLCEKLLSEQQK